MSLAVLPAMMFSLQVKFQSLYLLSFEGTRAISQDRNRCSFPSESDGKESAFSAGDVGSIPGSGRSPGRGTGHLLQYSCLENPMDRGAWQATVHVVTKSWTRLRDQHLHFSFKAITTCRQTQGPQCL